MGRSDQYITQRKLFVREELDEHEVEIVQTEQVTHYDKRDYTTVCIRWRGLHRIRFGDEVFLADESMTFDSGPKLGVSVAVTRQREVPYTEEERVAGRQNIIAVATQLLVQRGIW